MSKGLNALIFTIFGTVIGALATYEYMNKKNEKAVDVEVQKCAEYYENIIQTMRDYYADEEISEDEIESEEDIATYDSFDYNALTRVPEVKLGDESKPEDIEIFTENEYNTYHYNDADYETLIWTYYDDGILADDEDVIDETLGEAKEFIGEIDLNTYFDTTNADIVYIRNHVKKMDIEIAKSLLSFNEYLDGR